MCLKTSSSVNASFLREHRSHTLLPNFYYFKACFSDGGFPEFHQTRKKNQPCTTQKREIICSTETENCLGVVNLCKLMFLQRLPRSQVENYYVKVIFQRSAICENKKPVSAGKGTGQLWFCVEESDYGHYLWISKKLRRRKETNMKWLFTATAVCLR